MPTEYELLMPQSLPEALQMLAGGSPDVLPIAGGTNVIMDVRGGYRRPSALVDLSRLPELRGVRQEEGHVVVGGAVTIAELLEDPLIAQHGSVLQQAAAVFGNPLIRNRATVGGNLVNASSCADTAPPLLVLDAEVELVSHTGSRRLPLDSFLVGAHTTQRRPDELLLAVRWPLPPDGCAGSFRKLGLRKAACISKVSVAAIVVGNGDGVCRSARIAMGAVAPRATLATAAADLLCGQSLTPERVAEAARLAAEAARPRSGSGYKRHVVEAFVRRLLTGLAAKE